MTYPIIAILAVDWAGADHATENFDLLDMEAVTPVSAWICGFLVKETNDYILMCRDYFPETENHRCPIAIMKSTIKERIDYAVNKST